jgi:hypothetical protein
MKPIFNSRDMQEPIANSLFVDMQAKKAKASKSVLSTNAYVH